MSRADINYVINCTLPTLNNYKQNALHCGESLSDWTCSIWCIHDGTTIIGQLDYSPYAPHYVLHALKMEFHYAGVLIRKFVEIPGGGSDMLT